MLTQKLQHITDSRGNKISVILPIKEFEAMIEELEELRDICLYDEVKNSGESSLPLDGAFKAIEKKRKSS